ncbi:MFS transporter [Allokutzneria sp. A3M-2-11 16]|uniref:MFS transporter n=1 Tax=Allokutzneria sp. A3M-2-11 16 TaxID=2962043 RepID=UPI0020B7509F|nr:MFS transporter [Allokutzneria sp. A3M-2-11 16]MCP3801953.1 MFS transporter [Allokutzneria sp. A3M-2-11 16]
MNGVSPCPYWMAVPQLLMLPFGDLWADRYPRARLMITAEVLGALTSAALAVELLSGSPSIPVLTILAACAGLTVPLFGPASRAVVPEIVPADQLQDHISRRLAADAVLRAVPEHP